MGLAKNDFKTFRDIVIDENETHFFVAEDALQCFCEKLKNVANDYWDEEFYATLKHYDFEERWENDELCEWEELMAVNSANESVDFWQSWVSRLEAAALPCEESGRQLRAVPRTFFNGYQPEIFNKFFK